ncbi:MAG: FecR domain-containing protein [Planctomycetes bacterium]|nr:FecR domain-containing protein [Planctomycetota bacterium]
MSPTRLSSGFATRSSLGLAAAVLAALVALLAPSPASADAAYVRVLVEREHATLADAVRLVHRLDLGRDERNFEAGLNRLTTEGVVLTGWGRDGTERLTRDRLAFMVAEAVGSGGGFMRRTIGRVVFRERYALRDLQEKGIAADGAGRGWVSGPELIGTVDRAARWKKEGKRLLISDASGGYAPPRILPDMLASDRVPAGLATPTVHDVSRLARYIGPPLPAGIPTALRAGLAPTLVALAPLQEGRGAFEGASGSASPGDEDEDEGDDAEGPGGIPAEDTSIPPGTRVITVRRVNGDVQARRAGSAEWVEARVRMKLTEGAFVQTDLDSSCELEFDDGSVVEVEQLAQVALAEYYKDEGDVTRARVGLRMGRLNIDVKAGAFTTDFQVKSGNVTASVRGTFWRIHRSDRGTRVAADTGRVRVESRVGRSVDLSRGQVTNDKALPPIELRKVDVAIVFVPQGTPPPERRDEQRRVGQQDNRTADDQRHDTSRQQKQDSANDPNQAQVRFPRAKPCGCTDPAPGGP